MNNKISKVVILGGGTAGWMSAALIKKVVGSLVDVELVESDAIGTVGVGEATIPPIQIFNSVMGFNEPEFLKETKATIKLAIRFDNWRVPGEGYFHTFGDPGTNTAFCRFYDYWLRSKQLGDTRSIWDYDLNYLAAKDNKFAKMKVNDPTLEIPYAYHFDASLYAQYMRKLSEKMGAVRTEGKVADVTIDKDSGFVNSLTLESGQVVSGDLFIDCSGFRGVLIQEKLGTGYDDWSHWLPCDRAMAVPSERFEQTLPYTRSIAHSAGWQWRIPLQHRNGNGLVYSSAYYSDAKAEETLLTNLESTAIADPRIIRFKTGRRRKQWNRNVIAVGLSSGFIEPLESTSIHLIQTAIVRLLKFFPHNGIDPVQSAEYNRQSQLEYEQIRDFIILHYHVNERDDSRFWRDLRAMDIPDSLERKIELFRQSGRIFQEQDDLFLESSWLQVMVGQGIVPKDYHPLADHLNQNDLMTMLNNVQSHKQSPLNTLPPHDKFLSMVCKEK